MTIFRKTVLAAIAVIMAGTALTALPRPAHGSCGCAFYKLRDYTDRADLVFTGRLMQTIGPNDPSYHQLLSRSEGVTIIFEVEQVFKGQAGPLVAARTSDNHLGCGYPYDELSDLDATVPIITKVRKKSDSQLWEQGDIHLSLCGSWFPAYEIQGFLGPGYPPDETMVQVRELLENPNLVLTKPPPENKRSPVIYWLIGGAVLVLVGGTTLAIRLRAGNRAGRGATGPDRWKTGEQ